LWDRSDFHPSFHLTTGTFNLVFKDRSAFRLSDALSGPTELAAKANPDVLETWQAYSVPTARVNPLKSQDFHLLFTNLGSFIRIVFVGAVPIWELVRVSFIGALLSAQGNRSSARRTNAISASAGAEDAWLRKDRLMRLFATNAKTLRGALSPNEVPWPGQLFQGYPEIDAGKPARDTKNIRLPHNALGVWLL
jgi:hypothetical protein